MEWIPNLVLLPIQKGKVGIPGVNNRLGVKGLNWRLLSICMYGLPSSYTAVSLFVNKTSVHSWLGVPDSDPSEKGPGDKGE